MLGSASLNLDVWGVCRADIDCNYAARQSRWLDCCIATCIQHAAPNIRKKKDTQQIQVKSRRLLVTHSKQQTHHAQVPKSLSPV